MHIPQNSISDFLKGLNIRLRVANHNPCLCINTHCFRPESVCGKEDKKVLWYALVVGQPSGTRDLLKKASSLLVAEMATCDLSVESAMMFLRELRRHEREIYKSNVQPQLMSDKRWILSKNMLP